MAVDVDSTSRIVVVVVEGAIEVDVVELDVLGRGIVAFVANGLAFIHGSRGHLKIE